jgi:hypothetical protein
MSTSTYASFYAFALSTAAVIGSAAPRSNAGCARVDWSDMEPVVLNDNGAWSWFEDERAVVDPVAQTLLVSSVADAAGSGGSARDGNVEVAAYDLTTGKTDRAVLHAGLEADDHNSAALLVRSDGRYLAMYSRHSTDPMSRWRISSAGGSAAKWERESTHQHETGVTYSNLAPAVDGGDEVLYAFVRTVDRDPHLLVSRDDGSTWEPGGRLFDGPGRPYVRYAADRFGRVHLLTTEQHPDDFANGVYHGVIADGRLLGSDGRAMDDDITDDRAVEPQQLTELFSGDSMRRAWTVDLHVDALGNPYAAFSVHTTAGVHFYYYARFDGTKWHVHAMANAGSALYSGQPHYTGLVALHPHDPDRVFVSTDVDPLTGEPLISARDGRQHHELFEGLTPDGGQTWSWRSITVDSTSDNIRPIVPIWDSQHTALLWLRGTYTNYKNYDLDVVALVDRR